MAALSFSKYSGCGNDFVIIDNRNSSLQLKTEQIRTLCHRRYGVGADGVILLEKSISANHCMRIYNPDGTEAEMCGNGLRSLVAYLKSYELIDDACTIETLSGPHHCEIQGKDIVITFSKPSKIESLSIGNSLSVELVNTGVPHAIIIVSSLKQYDPFPTFAAPLLHHPAFGAAGANINLVQLHKNQIFLRTYERGVEAETFACGTGACAAALVSTEKFGLLSPITVNVASGEKLEISISAESISMSGAAAHIFDGTISLVRKPHLG